MSYTNLKKYKCQDLKTLLAKKQYEISKINLKGIKGITQFKKLNNEIDAIFGDLAVFKCDGIDYLYMPSLITPQKSKSTKLQLNRETDPRKLFIKGIDSHLPPKKRSSLR